MPRYVSLHTLACLTRQGAEELTARLATATGVTARRVLVNMVEGKMLVEFEVADRDARTLVRAGGFPLRLGPAGGTGIRRRSPHSRVRHYLIEIESVILFASEVLRGTSNLDKF